MFAICDTVVESIDAEVLGGPPERGGALLGIPGTQLVTHFVYDDEAIVTASTYRASDSLRGRVRQMELAGLEHMGIVHSHPAGLARPSGPDLKAFLHSLECNPHLSRYLVPIAVHDELPEAPNHVGLTRGGLALWEAVRTRKNPLECREVTAAAVPIGRVVRRVLQLLEQPDGIEVALSPILVEGASMASCEISLGAEDRLSLAFGQTFPLLPPLVLWHRGGEVEQIAIEWPLDQVLEDRLVPLVERLRELGSLSGAGCRSSRERSASVTEGLRARSGDLIGELDQRQTLVVGLGSVGSYLAEGLVRAGVGSLAIIDDDSIEAANLGRTVYVSSDLGRPKAEALRDRLLSINPDVAVESHVAALEDVSGSELRRLVSTSGVVVAATDDPRAQSLLALHCERAGTPAVFPGLYRGAEGGEVLLSVPGRTPCYRCATSVRHAVAATPHDAGQEMDYGTGRLAAEVGLAADIHHVSTAALRLALGALCLKAGGRSGDLVERAITDGTSYLLMGMHPDYWFFPQVFEGTPAQLAFQSVWVAPTSDPDCPICGELSSRTDLDTVSGRRPASDRVAAVLARREGNP